MAFYDNAGKFKILEVEINNAAVTTKSAAGVYYYAGDQLISYDPDYFSVLACTIIDWTGAKASFVPYVQEGKIKIMSDIEQTISSVKIRIVYL